MTWLWVILGIAAVVFLFSKLGGESTEDAAANAAGAGWMAGSCIFQIFISVVGIVIALAVFNWLFG